MSARKRGLHHRLYDWVLHWSGHPHAPTALFLLAVAESSVFPVPPDVLLIAMCMARPRGAAAYAALATVGSVAGGVLGYAIGWGAWQTLGPFCFGHLGFLGFTPVNFEMVQAAYRNNAFLAVFTAGFTPIPYKIFTIAAGVFGISMPAFLAASILGRAGRFFVVALLVGWLGARVKPFIERYLGWLTLAFVALLVIGFAALGKLGG